MSGLALSLVLIAAFFHAGWNFLAKKSRSKMAFIWWFLLIATIGYLPMFLYFWSQVTVTPAGWVCIMTTGFLHALYFWFMGGAYERGDLSLVYPLSRGSGPMFVPILIDGFLVLFAFRLSKVSYVVAAREVSIVFSAFLGIIWHKERHAHQKFAGAVLIALGVVFIGLSK